MISAPHGATFTFALLAAAAVLGASYLNLLRYLDYPLLRPEVAVVAAVLGAVALAVALIYQASERLGRALIEGLLVFQAIDLNSNFTWPGLGIGIAVAVLAYLKRLSVLPILLLFSGVILLTTLVGIGEQKPPLQRTDGGARAAGSGPAIVHIILDEHVGVAGIADRALRADVASFYASRGFRLFARAYSRHYHTVNAVPDILNFGEAGSSQVRNRNLRAGPTAYFGQLVRRGYALNIYQPEFGDYCSDNAHASCTRYSETSLAALESLPLATSEKARMIAMKLAALSVVALAGAEAHNVLVYVTGLAHRGVPLLDIRRGSRASTVAGMAAFDVLTSDLRQARRGNVYFAHLLFPHRPFVAASDCTVLPPSSWALGSIEARPAYHRQLRCVLRKLDGALAALAASPAGADAIVIVHGDHGSRLARVEPRADRARQLSGDDLIAGYSTLFAVRAPGLEGGLDPRPASAPELLHALTRSGFTSAEAGRRPGGTRTVMLEDRDWVPTRPVPLPEDWQDAADK